MLKIATRALIRFGSEAVMIVRTRVVYVGSQHMNLDHVFILAETLRQEVIGNPEWIAELRYPLIFQANPKVSEKAAFWPRSSWYRSTSGRNRGSGMLGMRS